jgi:hypothetical protein
LEVSLRPSAAEMLIPVEVEVPLVGCCCSVNGSD